MYQNIGSSKLNSWFKVKIDPSFGVWRSNWLQFWVFKVNMLVKGQHWLKVLCFKLKIDSNFRYLRSFKVFEGSHVGKKVKNDQNFDCKVKIDQNFD